MKPIIPRPLPNGGMVIAELPEGSKMKAWNGMLIVVHPDHQPLIVYPDGTTAVLKAPIATEDR